MQTVAQALQWAEAQLQLACHDKGDALGNQTLDPKVDARWLLLHVLQKNQAWLRAFADHVMSASEWTDFQALVARRGEGEPVAYLTGRQGFWTLDLEVTADTLVPRPDTELLVESALALLDDNVQKIVDLGTGTGAIALALASERPRWNVVATDIDAGSLQLARRNAERLQLPVSFLQSHWLRGLGDARFNLIVSNPPYIPANDPHLQGAGVRFEPLRALVSGVDGLDDIREIIATAPQHLFDGGWLLLEHGHDQGPAVRALFVAPEWQAIATRQDLGGNDRVTLARYDQHTAQ